MDKKRMGKRIIVLSIIIVILALAGGGVWWLFDSGRLVYNDPTRIACGADIVDRYNEAMYYKKRNGSTEYSIDEEGVKSLITEIKSKTNYETDPTCQSIIFWTAMKDEDYEVAKKAYDEVMVLHDQRLFADPNLRNDQPLFMYENTLETINPSSVDEKTFLGGE